MHSENYRWIFTGRSSRCQHRSRGLERSEENLPLRATFIIRHAVQSSGASCRLPPRDPGSRCRTGSRLAACTHRREGKELTSDSKSDLSPCENSPLPRASRHLSGWHSSRRPRASGSRLLLCSTACAVSPKRKKFSAPTSSRISIFAPSSVPMVRAPFMHFIFPVPMLLSAKEIGSDRSARR